MKNLRQIGFFTLVTIALVGCGTAAQLTISALPSPTASTPICNPSAPAPTENFCLTSAEQADGQTLVHMSTIPDSFFLEQNVSLTIAPSDTPSISEQTAESTAMQATANQDPQLNEAVLAEWHDAEGEPTTGQLTWIVNVTPSGGAVVPEGGGPATGTGPTPVPSRKAFLVVYINATTGQVTGIVTG